MITIALNNLSGFYIFSTYVPTFLMVVICYSTFYFGIDDFTDRIMISLTALLVLATLFTQITQTTPKTAYLKLLDVWFVSCIVMDFVIVILHVAINVVKMDEEEEANVTHVVGYKKPFAFKEKEKYAKALKYNRWAEIVLPIVSVLFAVVYIVVSRMFIL